MAYRGEDLDLRTPQTGVPGDLLSEPLGNGRSRLSASRTPILVDEVVLACCNHAFDVAGAHRSTEVRIEHLLHAMTRIDGGASALEARGLRLAGLRRESATIIASEIPIGLGSGQSRPRRSDDLETVLRTAFNYAARRNQAASVDDVIDALLEMPSDVPGITLLARHGGRTARDRLANRSYRSSISTELRSDLRSDERLSPRMSLAENRTDWNRSEKAQRDVLGTATDGIQNARIDQLENAVRALTSELASERNTVASLVQELHGGFLADRDDASRFRGGLDSRLDALEQAILDQRPVRANVDLSPLHDRLAALEQTILDQRPVRGAVDMGPLTERLKAIERAVENSNSKPAELDAIINRLDIIEEAVLTLDSAKSNDALTERLRALDETVAAQRAALMQATSSLTADVKSLGTALSAQPGTVERIQALVTERMQALAGALDRQRSDIVNGLSERLSALSSTIDGRLQQSSQPIADRFAALETRVQASTQPISERIGALDTQIKAQLAPVLQKLASIEALISQTAAKATELQAAHTAELKEVHEALLKLNTNQHTLAGSIDQWRLDGVGDVSVIANRLAAIEKSTSAPNDMLQQLSANVDNIGRATIERYHRRNRFWYWLFGTDDWLGASWPSQTAAVEQERATLRGGSARSAGVAQVPQVPR